MKSVRTTDASTELSTSQDVNDAFKSEVATLRAEIASIREKLAEKGGEAYENVSRRASDAASYVQDEAVSAAGAIREHPAAATTLFTLIGAIGFGLGYLVATSAAEQKQAWYRRYY
ncbi:hypothetical protein ACQKKX_14365 [Neorhizobium sp. NPDC001467]|uniref:hypothetical protein n=1 Tax=Neorhizobium sp. NPDC001467 TaxID=3390595 RepID=UPI003D024438